jgi:hypothetical protein
MGSAVPRLAIATVVDPADDLNAALLPGEMVAVGLAGDDEDGARRFDSDGDVVGGRIENTRREGGGRGGEGGDLVAARLPEEIGELPAIGMADGVDAVGIDAIVLLHRIEHRVEELEVAVVGHSRLALPGELLAFEIRH